MSCEGMLELDICKFSSTSLDRTINGNGSHFTTIMNLRAFNTQLRLNVLPG
jgi:hypothetical protein